LINTSRQARRNTVNNQTKYIDERLPEEYEKGLLEQITRKEAWITAQSTENKREKIQALTLDNQDSQQNA